MKIEGLLFTRLNEEYELFTQGERSKAAGEISKEEEEKLINAYEERILGDSLKALYDRYPIFYQAHVKNQETISKEMEESFRYFFAYINTADQVYESIRKYLNANTISEKYKFIVPHYGMLVRLADQIGVMLLNGYPDGAFRIWRSFYEYAAVTLLFIKERENDDLRKKYFDHLHRSKRKKSESLQKHYKELKFPPLEEGTVRKWQILLRFR